MERDDIQLATLSLSTHCPGMERRRTSRRTRGTSMQQDSKFTSSSCITNLKRTISLLAEGSS
jgi:hypothetical protein